MFEQIIIGALAFVAVTCIGGAVVVSARWRHRPLKQRLGLPGEPTAETTPLAQAVGRVGQAVSPKPSLSLQEQLMRAGFDSPGAAAIYIGAKALLLVVGLLAALLLAMILPLAPMLKGFVVLGVGGLMSFIPNAVLYVRRQDRSREVANHLPDAVDLLEVCVSSGIGLDMAWMLVTQEIRRVSTVLANEMALTTLEINLGAPRLEALRHMAQRTGAGELSSLVAVLVQSDRFGTSIADALRTFASSMRDMRSSKAEEAAEKMAVKLLFPMILFIFPVVLIVVAGPAAMILYRYIFSK